MGAGSERGEGRLGTIVGLVFFAAVIMAAWNIIPVYYANYAFQDKVVELARTPKYSHPDERIQQLLRKAAEEYNIHEHISPQTCKIESLETRRKIVCAYDRRVRVLPGYVHTFRFRIEADQPLI